MQRGYWPRSCWISWSVDCVRRFLNYSRTVICHKYFYFRAHNVYAYCQGFSFLIKFRHLVVVSCCLVSLHIAICPYFQMHGFERPSSGFSFCLAFFSVRNRTMSQGFFNLYRGGYRSFCFSKWCLLQSVPSNMESRPFLIPLRRFFISTNTCITFMSSFKAPPPNHASLPLGKRLENQQKRLCAGHVIWVLAEACLLPVTSRLVAYLMLLKPRKIDILYQAFILNSHSGNHGPNQPQYRRQEAFRPRGQDLQHQETRSLQKGWDSIHAAS